tara:strand:- start:738 stop:872 length:135 start_codon:yes stop_codon:yes gene_type:complete
MNIDKQYNKLKELMLRAEECTDRKRAKKIIKKSSKIQRKLNNNT